MKYDPLCVPKAPQEAHFLGTPWRTPWSSQGVSKDSLGNRKAIRDSLGARTPWGGRRFRSDPTVFFNVSRLPKESF